MSMTIGRGEITLILGPMFSGKTSELIRLVRRYTCAKRRCVVIKYFKDDRYSDDCAASHNEDTIPAIPTEHLTDVEAAVEPYDVIGIDEGQFISLISMAIIGYCRVCYAELNSP
jgi:thymidine kinase